MAERPIWQQIGRLRSSSSTSTAAALLRRVVQGTLSVGAASFLAAIAWAAWSDASQAWDVWYYHLPFAARLAGIVPADQYVFSSGNAARYAGFPLGAELLQGLFWRVTGRAESANFVALGSVVLFVLFMRRRFEVHWSTTLAGVLGVPLVMTHASSAYVDLPANVAAACLVLLVFERIHRRAEMGTAGSIALAIGCAVGAAHMRFQLAPLVAVSLLALGWIATAKQRLALVLAFPVVFAWPLKNLIIHHNPVFPVELVAGPLRFPGPDTPYSSSPVWLEHVPRPLRFAASVLELGLPSFSNPRRWSVDQWTPPDHDGYRMGGFFGIYVVVLLVTLLVTTARSERGSRARTFAWGFGALTALVAILPQSHELRYYMVWMLVLVAATAMATPTRWRPLLTTVGLLSSLAVSVVTRGAYVSPSGASFDVLVARHAGRERSGDSAHVCVHDPPWSFLHASTFHPPRRYVVVEAEDDGTCPAASGAVAPVP